ncbi:MAG: tryptophan 2,3-dioxygenase [Flavobacteriales bacterium]|nr:tryptophan 2,3-dioxygenase [Flavobacteriales bacterium]
MRNESEERLAKLEEKYASMGQDMNAYLDGLLISNYLPYWEYVNLDTLLTLQKPRTDFPDEQIFIMYHQITELYFRLALHEMEQIAHNGRNVLPNGNDLGWNDSLDPAFLLERLQRINRYFDALTQSYGVMETGMDKEQFLRFRMALLPASGFQSAQYRKIEICATPLRNLVHRDHRDSFAATADDDKGMDAMFQHIYWKAGATEIGTGKKTLTLHQFEQKYGAELLNLAKDYRAKNIWARYASLPETDRQRPELVSQMRLLDANVNINWPLQHYRTAARYLLRDKDEVAATGGTNWQQYLPPRFMKRIFFPDLWTPQEKDEWGRSWLIAQLNEARKE